MIINSIIPFKWRSLTQSLDQTNVYKPRINPPDSVLTCPLPSHETIDCLFRNQFQRSKDLVHMLQNCLMKMMITFSSEFMNQFTFPK
jgi:hypothetical protein